MADSAHTIAVVGSAWGDGVKRTYPSDQMEQAKEDQEAIARKGGSVVLVRVNPETKKKEEVIVRSPPAVWPFDQHINGRLEKRENEAHELLKGMPS